MGDTIGEEGAVGEACEFVVERSTLELRLELTSGGDVTERDDDRTDVLVGNQVASGSFHGEVGSGAAREAALERNRRAGGEPDEVDQLGHDRRAAVWSEGVEQ